MIASWLSLKESNPNCSCRCDSKLLVGCAFSFGDLLLLTALVFLGAIFFVSVDAMLKYFLSHEAREITQNRFKVVADSVKIRRPIKSMKKFLMCFSEQIRLYVVIDQHLAGQHAIKFYKRHKYPCKR